MREEIFGPVLPIVIVANEDEALRLANDSDFGLGASIWTRGRTKGERIARWIETGMVWINDHSYTHAAVQCAWGGVKDSGLGRSHSQFGLIECAEIKTVTWNTARSRDFWWQPYDETLGGAIRASAGLLYGGDGPNVKVLRDGGGALLKTGARPIRGRGGSPQLTRPQHRQRPALAGERRLREPLEAEPTPLLRLVGDLELAADEPAAIRDAEDRLGVLAEP